MRVLNLPNVTTCSRGFRPIAVTCRSWFTSLKPQLHVVTLLELLINCAKNCPDKLCKSYRKKLGALRRMPRLSPKELEEIYFKTVVSGVSYCIPVWGGCTAPLFNKLEDIHSKQPGLFTIYHATEITPMFYKKANWLPLSYMYKKAILKYVHQAFYQAGPAQITELFSVKATKYDSPRSKQLVLDRTKKEIGRLSLRHRGTMIWNSIPSSVKEYDNVILFKNRL